MTGRSVLKSGFAPMGLAAAALLLAGCSETISGFSPTTHVAEVDADAAAQASNAGNIASLTEVIERNPRDAAAYNTRGVVYAKLGHYSDAIADFTHTIDLDPNFSGAYTNRALAYRQTHKDNLALQDFNQAITVNPNDAAAYLGISKSAMRRMVNAGVFTSIRPPGVRLPMYSRDTLELELSNHIKAPRAQQPR